LATRVFSPPGCLFRRLVFSCFNPTVLRVFRLTGLSTRRVSPLYCPAPRFSVFSATLQMVLTSFHFWSFFLWLFTKILYFTGPTTSLFPASRFFPPLLFHVSCGEPAFVAFPFPPPLVFFGLIRTSMTSGPTVPDFPAFSLLGFDSWFPPSFHPPCLDQRLSPFFSVYGCTPL